MDDYDYDNYEDDNDAIIDELIDEVDTYDQGDQLVDSEDTDKKKNYIILII